MKNPKRNTLIKTTLAATLLTVAAANSHADKTVLIVADQIPFAKNADVPDKVKAECNLGMKLSKFIKVYAKKSGFDVQSSSSAASDLILDVEMTSAFANPGGAFSGAKTLHIKGSARQNNKVIGTFEGRRYSMGGAFAAFKGTCSIIGRNTKALGRDIATWLKAPTKDAKLGDL